MRRGLLAALGACLLIVTSLTLGSGPAHAWSAQIGFAQYLCWTNTLDINIGTQDESVGTDWIINIDGSPAPGGKLNGAPYTGNPPTLAPGGNYHLEVNGGVEGGHLFSAQVRRIGDASWTTVTSRSAYPGCGDAGTSSNQTGYAYNCATDTLAVFADNRDFPAMGRFFIGIEDTDSGRLTFNPVEVPANGTVSVNLRLADGDGWSDFRRGTSTRVRIQRDEGESNPLGIATGTIITLGCDGINPEPTPTPVTPAPTTPVTPAPPQSPAPQPTAAPPATAPRVTVLGKVARLKAKTKSGKLAVTWKPITGATGYKVKIGNKVNAVRKPAFAISLKKVNTKKKVAISVRAINAAGKGKPAVIRFHA